MTEEQLFKFLGWMIEHGIIDYNDFNQLLLKSLPYVE